jgi:hypothetical protein
LHVRRGDALDQGAVEQVRVGVALTVITIRISITRTASGSVWLAAAASASRIRVSGDQSLNGGGMVEHAAIMAIALPWAQRAVQAGHSSSCHASSPKVTRAPASVPAAPIASTNIYLWELSPSLPSWRGCAPGAGGSSELSNWPMSFSGALRGLSGWRIGAWVSLLKQPLGLHDPVCKRMFRPCPWPGESVPSRSS